MTFLRYLAALGAVAAALAPWARAEEDNLWPFYVGHTDEKGQVQSWTALGPFFFSHPEANGDRVSGFRPLYLRRDTTGLDTPEVDVAYPIFYWRSYRNNAEWSVLKLANRFGKKENAPAAAPRDDEFDLWPFYFSRQNGDPQTSYRALFPIYGTMKNRFSRDRISWVLWPLFVQTNRDGETTTSAPYPFIRVTRGAAHGFALWPLFGWNSWPGAYTRHFYLWPLGWDDVAQIPPDAPGGAGVLHKQAFLPFYLSVTSPAVVDKVYGWPFFGYTDRTAPFRYHETRYLWPFLVQGRGDARYVNRWGPFYTHSVLKGYDKTWVLWPLWRDATWKESGVRIEKQQFVFWFYWNLIEHSLSNPSAAPARTTHVWPLLSIWDNGADRAQVEIFSPFEVFFPHNDKVRPLWSPLTAVYRYDRNQGDTRASLLWDAVTWSNSRTHNTAEFHLGPLLGVERTPYARRVSLLHGLLGWEKRPADRGWHAFWLEFSGHRNSLSSASR
ncbi:MAG TPA: hypothetical protein VHV47_06670 [Opitutaceae bacterium]|jgi:hypothetical protein|nr:hypothetical protein [Opitutaceae bacterium]